MNDNMLIKKENISIFRKIFIFIKSAFYKNKKVNEEKREYPEVRQENNMIKELKEKRTIIELRSKYEAGAIKEEDLTEEEKEKLKVLYKEQICTLEETIQIKLKELEFYKQKMISGT